MATRRRFFSGRALEVMRYPLPYTDEPPTEAEKMLYRARTRAWIWASMDPAPGKLKRGYREERSPDRAVKLLIYQEAGTETCEDILVSTDRGRTYHCPLEGLPPAAPP